MSWVSKSSNDLARKKGTLRDRNSMNNGMGVLGRNE